jgi:hypothetical protein
MTEKLLNHSQVGPHARISWPLSKRAVDLHEALNSSTEEEAEEIALRLGRHWVNKRLFQRRFRKEELLLSKNLS